MIKDIVARNESVAPNSHEIGILKEHFSACFHKDGTFDIERFKGYLSDKVNVVREGYELKFLGKNYAKMLASLDTTTVVRPNEEHNSKPENVSSENIYISGDNLDGLKHLLKSYARKVKCIYIDPPYNTGTDGFVYNDKFNFTVEELSEKLSISEDQAQRILDLTKRGSASHSAWLMFMYPRLLLARDLLADDGVILISIDDNEQVNLQLICNDVFGEEEHLVTMARRTKSGGGSAADQFAIEHDYVCVYCRSKASAGKLYVPFSEEYLQRYSEEDADGPYFWDTMERSSTKTRPYKIKAPDGTLLEGKWFRSEKRFLSDLQKGDIRIIQKTDGNWSVQFKQRLAKGKKMRSLLADKEFKSYSDDLEALGLNGTFSYPKTVFLIKHLLQVIESGSIVIDFFSGSATTAQAVMELNQERLENGEEEQLTFVMVQINENLDDKLLTTTGDAKTEVQKAITVLDETNRPHTLDQIGIERIIRAAKAIKEANPDTAADLGFRHFTLAEPSDNTLDKLETFTPEENGLIVTNTVFEDFGKPTVLTTWLVRDGYGFTAPVEKLDFAGYKAYYIGKHLYFIEKTLPNEAIEAIVVKYETDGAFNPENVILFGYSFTWTELEALQTNLKKLKDKEKNLHINFDIRY